MLEDYVQLHEDLTIWYVVDGYQVTYSTQDGERQLITAKRDTIALALTAILDVLVTKTLQEWRRSTESLEV